MYTSNNNFDFNSIPAEKPASWNQLKSRVGNTNQLMVNFSIKWGRRLKRLQLRSH